VEAYVEGKTEYETAEEDASAQTGYLRRGGLGSADSEVFHDSSEEVGAVGTCCTVHACWCFLLGITLSVAMVAAVSSWRWGCSRA
jgi:hypothetical protein